MGIEKKVLVRMENIEKEFPGVKALKGVNFDVRAGEIHALVGENGAGKSTLIKILMGVYPATSGKIYLEEKEAAYKNPYQAKKSGLGAVYQDITLAPHLSVAENFFLGELPRKMGTVDWKTINNVTKQTLADLGIDIDPKIRVMDLTVGQQEMVTIAKTVHQKANVIVFDEPTALLANEEVSLLFDLIKKLTERNYGIIYISHRLEEIFALCDRVTVLKDGAHVRTLDVKETNQDQLVKLMVGRDIEDMYGIKKGQIGETILKVENLTREGKFRDVSFEVKRGQIVGMFGLVGAGRTEVCRALFGADPYDSGAVYVKGKKVHNRTPMEGMKNAIAFLTEDRKKDGLCLGLSVEVNTNLASYSMISKRGLINLKQERERAERYRDAINIKTPSVRQLCKNLSGGNQQKVVVAKWLCRESEIFIFDEPTVGVDVGAKVEIYKLIEELILQGKAVILISSYLPEVMGLSDEMIIMSEGKQMAILDKSEFYYENGKLNEEKALKLSSGIA
jgi:ribose transport system ATP-binding protein